MPIERRDIILINEEALLAVRAQARMEPWLFPPGQIIAVDINKNEEPLLVTVATAGAPNKRESVALNRQQAVEVLIRFCLENNIPLPRLGYKTAIIVPGPGGTGPHICLRLVST